MVLHVAASPPTTCRVSILFLMSPRFIVIPRWEFGKEVDLSLEPPSSSGGYLLCRLPTHLLYLLRNFDSQQILIP